MSVTKATIEDLESILHLNRLFHLDFPWFKWDTKEWVGEELKNGNYYVIKDDRKILAAMCLKMLNEEGHIETLAVQQEKQGKGFAKRLIDFAKDYSKQKGKSKLLVESFCDYGLEKFYKRCGFVKSPKIEDYKGHPYYCFSIAINN